MMVDGFNNKFIF